MLQMINSLYSTWNWLIRSRSKWWRAIAMRHFSHLKLIWIFLILSRWINPITVTLTFCCIYFKTQSRQKTYSLPFKKWFMSSVTFEKTWNQIKCNALSNLLITFPDRGRSLWTAGSIWTGLAASWLSVDDVYEPLVENQVDRL